MLLPPAHEPEVDSEPLAREVGIGAAEPARRARPGRGQPAVALQRVDGPAGGLELEARPLGELPQPELALARAAEEPKKLKKPELELRASPRYAFSPADVMFTAELKGGDDVEEFYCPELEWEWGDGGKSVQESDCEPWTAATKIERRFTSHHTYARAGLYYVRVRLRKSGKGIAAQSVQLTIRAGVGDPSNDPSI